jgi:hypothetical protein
MKSSKNLLFPFSTDSPYFEGYSWAVSLAVRMDANLRLLAKAPQSESPSEQHNTIFCSLLEAHGYYLERYHHHSWPRPGIRRQPLTNTGDLGQDLLNCLGDEPTDIVIIDPPFKEKHIKVVKKLMKGPTSIILLDAKPGRSKIRVTHTDLFYQQLMEAEFHNLPPQFYMDLGKDISGYNYLRKLFQLGEKR